MSTTQIPRLCEKWSLCRTMTGAAMAASVATSAQACSTRSQLPVGLLVPMQLHPLRRQALGQLRLCTACLPRRTPQPPCLQEPCRRFLPCLARCLGACRGRCQERPASPVKCPASPRLRPCQSPSPPIASTPQCGQVMRALGRAPSLVPLATSLRCRAPSPVPGGTSHRCPAPALRAFRALRSPARGTRPRPPQREAGLPCSGRLLASPWTRMSSRRRPRRPQCCRPCHPCPAALSCHHRCCHTGCTQRSCQGLLRARP
mmetsp:Transcript_72855/g.196391  ORF Transcript_72855/g.196391 Transcript_72855/m.196391 type:complete len:259 (-) Transcript_72855:410-1186(-)